MHYIMAKRKCTGLSKTHIQVITTFVLQFTSTHIHTLYTIHGPRIYQFREEDVIPV